MKISWKIQGFLLGYLLLHQVKYLNFLYGNNIFKWDGSFRGAFIAWLF